MKFLTNTSDPRKPGWERYQVLMWDIDPAEQIYWHLDWLKDKYIGKPKATAKYSTRQLRKMGMVGIYAYDNPKIQKNPIQIVISASSAAAVRQVEAARAAFRRLQEAGEFAKKYGSPATTLTKPQSVPEWETSALELRRAFEEVYPRFK